MAVRSSASGRSSGRSTGTERPGVRRRSAVARRSELERQRRTWRVVNIVLAVLLVVTASTAAVAGGIAGYSAYREHQIREGHRAASAAARQVVVDFLTISAASVTRDLRQVLDGSTGEFRKQYQAGMSEVRTAVVENKVSSTGRVLRSGVVSGDADSAVVLVAVDARITNVRSPKGRKAHYRVQVDMVYHESRDRWLVSRLEFVG